MPSLDSNSRCVPQGERNDQFYTQLPDIENEVRHYTKYFKGKVVYCNCDDPYESNFFKFFVLNFSKLGLKKLITTSYARSPIAGTELKLGEQGAAYKIEVSAVYSGDGFCLDDMKEFLKSNSKKKKIRKLKGDGDFRSEECVELLKESDIVVTFPPPSLLCEYVAQLLEYKKDFLVIGRLGACTTKEIFPLIKENKLRIGQSCSNGHNIFFKIPYEIKMGDRRVRMTYPKPVLWYTTLDHGKRHEDFVLYETYSPKKYPKYDNYDAINVNKLTKIPRDYDGVMGVPITFLEKYSPDQFELLGCSDVKDEAFSKNSGQRPRINGGKIYVRIFIRKKQQF